MKSPSLSTSQPKAVLPRTQGRGSDFCSDHSSERWGIAMSPGTSGLMAGKLYSTLSVSAGSQTMWRRRRKNFPTWMKRRRGKQRRARMRGRRRHRKTGWRADQMPKLGTTKGKETGEPHFHSLNIHMLSDGHWVTTGMGGEKRGPPSSAWCQRTTPHHCCELFSSHRDTHLVLRIRGCQVPMIHSLHLPNGISPKPMEKIPFALRDEWYWAYKTLEIAAQRLCHANLAPARVCLTKQICNHRITCSFSPARPLPCLVLRMVLLTECSISYHFFSLSFNLPPHSLLLSSPLFSMLHPTTASTITLEVPNLTVHHSLNLWRAWPHISARLPSMKQMEDGGSRK